MMKMMLMMFNGIYYLLDGSDSIHADDDDCIDNDKTMDIRLRWHCSIITMMLFTGRLSITGSLLSR